MQNQTDTTRDSIMEALGQTGGIILGKLQEYAQFLGILVLAYILLRSTVVILYVCLRWARMRFGSRIKPSADRAIVVTGATSGFGLCLAKRLHKLGFTVFACYYSELESGYAELKALEGREENSNDPLLVSRPNRMILVPLDIGSQESIVSCHATVTSQLDEHSLKLHALVNNAGCAFDGPFEWSERKYIRKVIDINLMGPILMARQFVNRIVQDQGRFVNVSSGIEVIPCKSLSIYGASKSGLAYFSEALNLDLRGFGAASYCILPGNLIQSTNIMFTRHKGMQDSIAALTETERSLYKNSIDKSLAVSEGMMAKRLRVANLDLDEIERTYGINLDKIRQRQAIQAPASGTKRGCFSWKPHTCIGNMVKSLSNTILVLTSGSAPGKSLEDSGILIAFEAALLMKDAPKRIYMGSPLYTYVMGPLAEVLPPVMYRSVSGVAFNTHVRKHMGRGTRS